MTDTATQLLTRSLENERIHSAYLISGPLEDARATALRFARGVVCEGTERPCEECGACRRSSEREEIELPVSLVSADPLTGVSAVLTSSTPGVVILDDTAGFPDLPGGGGVVQSDPPHFRVSLPDTLACSSSVDFDLTITDSGGNPVVESFSQPIGWQSPDVPLAIPDLGNASSEYVVTQSRIIDGLEGLERFLHPAAVADWMETHGIAVEDVLESDRETLQAQVAEVLDRDMRSRIRLAA